MRFLLLIFITQSTLIIAQETKYSVGVGLYTTGSEYGLGFRSSKVNKMCFDVRFTKTLFTTNPNTGGFNSEINFVHRVVKQERLNFHIGYGFKTDINVNVGSLNKYGVVFPVGVEAFPFPFQQAGLFFEVAPFYITTTNRSAQFGLRSAAGFVFYFTSSKK